MKIPPPYGLRWLSVIGSLIRFPRVNWVSFVNTNVNDQLIFFLVFYWTHNHSPTKTVPVFNSSERESVGFSSNFFAFNTENVNAHKLIEDSEQGLLPLRLLFPWLYTVPLQQNHPSTLPQDPPFINHLFRARHSCQRKFKSFLFKLLY